MRHVFAGAILAAFLLLSWSARSATQPARKTPAKKSTVKKAPAKKSTTTARKSTGSTAGRTTTARKTAKKAPARNWRTRQMAPTPDRYREIQQALVSKGYLKPEDATGVWSQNSTDALKRFQSEQNIESTGKINSLSLIALGLGPRHDTAAVKPPTPQPPVPEAAGRM